jgi:hypothetical protein
MSGYITRNALMTDNPTFGPPAQNPGWGAMLPSALPNQLTAPAWGAPPMQPGMDGSLPTMPGTAAPNDDLAKLMAQFYGGQAQPQQLTPAQQLQQAINADQANYHGREGGGLV